jgi:hypothetical protein
VATSALDVREPRVAVPGAVPSVRRLPATVLGAAAIGAVESVALLAGALTGLDGVLASPDRPDGAVVALVLLTLAGWIVGCAGGAATLVDGAGRGILAWVAYVELALVGLLFLVGLLTSDLDPFLPAALPLPAVALLFLAIPTGKLLLAGSPTALAWVAAGPRPRERRPDPVAAHRGLCTATLAGIALVLGVVALVAPAVGTGPDAPGSVVSSTH